MSISPNETVENKKSHRRSYSSSSRPIVSRYKTSAFSEAPPSSIKSPATQFISPSTSPPSISYGTSSITTSTVSYGSYSRDNRDNRDSRDNRDGYSKRKRGNRYIEDLEVDVVRANDILEVPEIGTTNELISPRPFNVTIEKVSDVDWSKVTSVRSGIIPYYIEEGSLYFLMGVSKEGDLTDFGGGVKHKKYMENALTAACREFIEETLGV